MKEDLIAKYRQTIVKSIEVLENIKDSSTFNEQYNRVNRELFAIEREFENKGILKDRLYFEEMLKLKCKLINLVVERDMDILRLIRKAA